MSYKMKGFSGFKPSPAKAKDKVATKTQTLQGREAYPGGSTFKGSETSSVNQQLEKGNDLNNNSYTNYPADKNDATQSTVTGGKTIYGGAKTVKVSDSGGRDGIDRKSTTKKRRGGSKKKEVVFSQDSTGKTTKRVTRYKKDGTRKGEPKTKSVRSNNFFTGKSKVTHSKKNQELVDKAETTYTKGPADSSRGR
tara:strand:- start:62 stop:643 length:582 start_codon:yes stop_codon:yes gene_type:complete